MRVEYTISGIAALLLVGLFALLVWSINVGSEGRRFCLSHGYPEAVVYKNGSGYCIKRVDQTDVVTPFESLRK